MDAVRAAIRDVPDFPKKGILFKDLTPVLAAPALFRQVIDGFAARWRDEGIARIVSVESRGFLFGAPLAYAIDAGLGIVRKPGKLPYQTVRESYDLEYGQDSLELHIDAVSSGERVLIVDDLLATGGHGGCCRAAGRAARRDGGGLRLRGGAGVPRGPGPSGGPSGAKPDHLLSPTATSPECNLPSGLALRPEFSGPASWDLHSEPGTQNLALKTWHSRPGTQDLALKTWHLGLCPVTLDLWERSSDRDYPRALSAVTIIRVAGDLFSV